MFERIEPSETIKRDLTSADESTLVSLYQDVELGHGGCAASGAPPLFIGVFLLFLAAVRVRPARRPHLREDC